MNKRLLWLGLAWSVAHQLSAESFTTNVIDGVSTNITTEFVLGDTGPYNFLLITNGGAMTNLARSFIGNTVEAHNNMAVVAGPGSVWDLDQILVLGSRSASNVLAILGGGFLGTSQPLTIGSGATASNNILHIAGAGSRLAAPAVYLSTYGPANQLLAEDGAYLTVPYLNFNSEGGPDGGRQTAVLRGIGTVLSTSTALSVGNSPANSLSILDGAESVNGNSAIGTFRSPFNRVVVSGTGSRWKNSFDVIIGGISSPSNDVLVADGAAAQTGRLILGQHASDNSYTVQSAGRFTAAQIIIGDQPNAVRNRLLVTGAGTTLSNSSILTVGQNGSQNLLVLSNSAFAQSGDCGLGMQFVASNNQAIATGTNTLWIANRLTVGSAGDFNTLTIEDGANVFASSLLSGGQGGSGNTTYVSGRGSLLSLTNGLDLGGDNNTGNFLVITNDARVESGSGVVGSYGWSSSAIISRSSWSNMLGLAVGYLSRDNLLLLRDNARLYSSNAVVGVGELADRNRVEVSGKGTALRVVNELNVGSWGDSNEVAALNGAAISANGLNVGGYFVPNPPAIFPSDANRLVIHGTNTIVNVASNISLGYNGRSNRLELRAKAQLTSSSAEVATRAGSTDNTILMSDPGTRWHNTNLLVLGSNGYGSSLTVATGARLTTGATILGDGGFAVPVGGGGKCTNRFGFNSVLVGGAGALWEVGGQLIIGKNSTSNYVTVNQGGTLRASEIMAGFFGTACLPQEDENVFVLDGGNLVVSNRLFVGPRGRFRMLSGRAEVDSFWVESYPSRRAEVLGGTLRADSIYASAPAWVEIGDGIRRAVLELTGGNYFSSGRIIIASNSVVAGRGSIAGFTNSGTYGTLRSITAITNASLQGSSGFDVWISALGPATGHSVLDLVPAAFGTPVLNGRLRVALNPSFQPQSSNEFPIVMFTSATGAFVNAPHESRLKTVDNLASFLVLYRSSAVVLTDYRSTDLDGDAIEDAWATNHFGHSPLTSAERAADNDGDGLSNYDEFRAGTDPSDPASALRVSVTVTQGTTRLQWSCVDGKTYRIYISGDMRSWQQVSDPTFAFPQAGVCEWTDDGRDAGSASGRLRFFRVAVE